MRRFTLAALLATACSAEPPQAPSRPPSAQVEPAAAAAPLPDGQPAPTEPAAAPSGPAVAAATPMKDWMVASLARPVKQQDFAALERALHTTAGYAPSEFPEWGAIAERGARAAAAHDIEAVRESCTACHNEYRADYREQMRSRPLLGVK
jgi:hypothetical protein